FHESCPPRSDPSLTAGRAVPARLTTLRTHAMKMVRLFAWPPIAHAVLAPLLLATLLPAAAHAEQRNNDEYTRKIREYTTEKFFLTEPVDHLPLAGGAALANQPAVVDVPVGKGHILFLPNNTLWRPETTRSFFILFH